MEFFNSLPTSLALALSLFWSIALFFLYLIIMPSIMEAIEKMAKKRKNKFNTLIYILDLLDINIK